MLLRFPLGARVLFRWVCKGHIEGLITARVEFHRQPGAGERITLDSFELPATPADFDGSAYKLRGVPPPGLHAGIYRPTLAHVRVREHSTEVTIDLWEYGQEFALELFDDSILNAPA
jgi:hypothetical protein